MSGINDKDIIFSFLKGANYTFHLNENIITFFASSWSGKEVVKVNGNVISKTREYSKKSKHKFELNGSKYEIVYESKSTLTGGWRCSLYQDSVFIKAFVVKMEGGYKYIGAISIVIGVIFGIIISTYIDHLLITLPIFIVTLFTLNKFKQKLVYEVE